MAHAAQLSILTQLSVIKNGLKQQGHGLLASSMDQQAVLHSYGYQFKLTAWK